MKARTGKSASGKRQRAQIWGRRAELLAVWRLRCAGWHIVARDWRRPQGEIDIIARRGKILALVEVKARESAAAAAEAVQPHQRRRIARAAEAFLCAHPELQGLDWRFDLVVVVPWRLPRHLPDAWRES